jgi:hypothetical protein
MLYLISVQCCTRFGLLCCEVLGVKACAVELQSALRDSKAEGDRKGVHGNLAGVLCHV